jgi:hypothetical protein
MSQSFLRPYRASFAAKFHLELSDASALAGTAEITRSPPPDAG